MFRLYASSIMNGRGFNPMYNADSGSGGDGSGTGGDDDKGEDKGSGDGTGDDGDQDKDEPIKFDEKQQAEIDRIIKQRLAKEAKKQEKAVQDAIEREKMTAEEKAEQDRIVAEKKAKDREAKANERVVNLEIKDIAREMGVPSKKLERFLKVVDREDIEVDDDGNVDRSQVETAVKALLADMPEFKGPDNQKGPGGDFNGTNNSAKFSKTQIQAMQPEEIAKNWDDVQASMKIHNQK